MPHGPEPLTVQSQPSFLAEIPNEQEDLTKLMREALTCKEHARVLQSALAHVKPSRLDSDPIVQVGLSYWHSNHVAGTSNRVVFNVLYRNFMQRVCATKSR